MSDLLIPETRSIGAESSKFRSRVREFLASELAAGTFEPVVDCWISGWDPEFSRRLGEKGLLGITIPARYGGAGGTHIDRYVVTEELLAAGAPVAAHWVADRQVAPSLLRHGTDEQRERYLPGIARGEKYFAIGMSEPESGSDLASVRTTATRVDGGWSISGTKVWTSGAHHSEAFFVLARSEPLDTAHRHRGLSQFVVDLDSPGIEIRPIKLLTGVHHFNEVVLDKVFVPDSMVLGRPGDGWAQVTSELAVERSGPERILSTMPLLTALDRSDIGDGDLENLGGLIARGAALRALSLSIASALADGDVPDVAAALVKELGTRYEGDIVAAAALWTDAEPDPTARSGMPKLLAEGLLHRPGFTIRGGTNEILRSVIARGLGLR